MLMFKIFSNSLAWLGMACLDTDRHVCVCVCVCVCVYVCVCVPRPPVVQAGLKAIGLLMMSLSYILD